jgi:hypothetical protein
VLAQAPLTTLLHLDPYVPSQGELLRLGRGIPLWPVYQWQPCAPLAGPLLSERAIEAEPIEEASTPLLSFADVVSILERERRTSTGAVAPAVQPTGGDRMSGVWIEYGGRTWVSAGRAVPFRESDFVRVGESATVSIYRRAGSKDDVIFVPSTPRMVAPFRARQ